MKLLINLALILPVLFSFPEPTVRWQGGGREALEVQVKDSHELISQCIKSGLTLRYRFETQLCRRRSLWYDTCNSELVQIHKLSFEPVSESYTIVSDKLGDQDNPVTTTYESFLEAVKDLSMVQEIKLDELARGDQKLLSHQRAYANVRVVVDCKGEYNETLNSLSQILTLGIVDIGSYDSGWISYRLRD